MLTKDDYNNLAARIFKLSLEKIRRKEKIKVGGHVTVSYGKLITPEEMGFDKEKFGPHDIRNAANLVMDRITELWEAER